MPTLGQSIAPRDARHSYAVLRGLTSSGGGMVAAATMSLPERAAQGRNYDYRYGWIRDQCYAGQAVAADGAHPLLDDAVRFGSERLLADGPHLKPAYTIAGAPVPDQRSPWTCPAIREGRTLSVTTSMPSSSSMGSARRCWSSPPPPGTTISAPSTTRPSPPPSAPSPSDGERL